MTSKFTNCSQDRGQSSMMVTEIRTRGLMNEQAFTWLRRRALHMHKLLHGVRGREQTSGCNSISHLLCQNDVRGQEKEMRSRVSYSKVWPRQERLTVIFNGMKSVSLWLYVNCSIFFNRYMGKGVQYIRYSTCYCRQKNYNKTFFKETAPLKREWKHFQKYNVFYRCRNLLLIHWITRF